MATTVANFDVAGGCDRIVTFASELIGSQSASQAEFSVHDRDRAKAYLDRLEGYIVMISEPVNPLDLPKTHPGAYPVNEFPADESINAIENAEVRDLVRRFKAAYVELVQSQSKDRASGIYDYDKGRLVTLIENARGVITFGEASVDLPENPADVPATETAASRR